MSAPGEVALGAPRTLAYPDVMLSHDWHLDPKRTPVPAVSRSARKHAEEVRRRRQQRRNPMYAARLSRMGEDQATEAAYQNALAFVLRASEGEARVKEEEASYEKQLVEAMALFAIDDCVI
ncbi:hypothetical protein D1007_04195 [Hordeum vulgare]|nr:hypothetical protein D1007_04195 [Hordeum vulgare]